MTPRLQIRPEVAAALEAGRAVVALESTVISHGLPPPHNLEIAQRLEAAAPAMKKKGRVQQGADADLVVFDPLTVLDRATYEKGDVPAAGIRHVLVGGTFVVRDETPVEGIYPGTAVVGQRR